MTSLSVAGSSAVRIGLVLHSERPIGDRWKQKEAIKTDSYFFDRALVAFFFHL